MLSSLSRHDGGSIVEGVTKKNQAQQAVERRPQVCGVPGPMVRETMSLFNTWMAPDTNPERREELPSLDGKKVIVVRGFMCGCA